MTWKVKLKAYLRSKCAKIFSCMPTSFKQRLRQEKVTVLLYHNIDAKLFKIHLDYLEKSYNFISLKTLADTVTFSNWAGLPSSPLVITFDDGWKENFQLLQVIKKRSLPVTIFLPTELIFTRRKIWNYVLDRTASQYQLNQSLKSLPNQQRIQFLKETVNFSATDEFEERDFLSRTEINAMLKDIDFQSHGVWHSVLTQCDDDELSYEVEQSKKFIDEEIGQKCFAFAYPYGRNDERVRAAVETAGYQIGRAANTPYLATRKTDRFRIPAINIPDECDVKCLGEEIALAEVRTLFAYT